MDYAWSLIRDYKWRLITEQIFFCLVALMAVILDHQLQGMDLYFGISLALFTLKGRASLIGLLLGGLLGTALLPSSTQAWLIAWMIPVQASLVSQTLLKMKGPFLPLMHRSTYLHLSALILIHNLIIQAFLYNQNVSPSFLWLASQILNGVMWLGLFSQWDSYIPSGKTNHLYRKYLCEIGGLFLMSILFILFQHTGWEWLFVIGASIFLYREHSHPLLMRFLGIIVVNVTVGLYSGLAAGWHFLILFASWCWGWVSVQAESN